jgi:hypothetical protein
MLKAEVLIDRDFVFSALSSNIWAAASMAASSNPATPRLTSGASAAT